MHRPLVGLCLFYTGGIFLGWCLDIASFQLHYLFFPLVLLFLTAAFSFLKGKLRFSNILIYICLLLLGMVAYSLRANPAHPHHIANLLQGEEEKKVILEGTLIKDPEVRGTTRGEEKSGNEDGGTAKERTVLTLKAERIKIPPHPNLATASRLWRPLPPGERMEEREERWEKVVGLVQVSVRGKDGVGDYGERIRIVGMSLRKPPLPENPREFDYRRYLARKGIYAVTNVYYPGQIEVLGTGEVNPFVRIALSIKDRMKGIIEETMKYPQTVLLTGILLGERWGIPVCLTLGMPISTDPSPLLTLAS